MSETGARRTVARNRATAVDQADPALAAINPAVVDTPAKPANPVEFERPLPDGAPAHGDPIAAPPWFGGGNGGGSGGKTRAKRNRRWIWIALAIVVVLAALVWFFLIPHGQPQGQAGRGGPGGGRFGANAAVPTVGMAVVQRGDIPIYLDALGTVTPLASVTVVPQVSGQLVSVNFQEGQIVQRGQFLAQIDDRPFKQTLAQHQGAQARDEALLAAAQVDLKRYQTLLQQDSIASQQVDTQAALVKQDEANVLADKAQVGADQLNITYAHIVSPVTGRVGLRTVDPGNYVTSASTTGVASITQITPIDVLFTMPEDNLPQVTARLRGGAKLPVTAFDRAQKTQLAQGQLLTLDNKVDTTTGTVRAKARFGNEGTVLFPNQFVNVRVLVDTLKNAVVVPNSAVLRGSQGLFVYVINADRTVTVRNIQIGPVSGQSTAVVSGLEVNERVVTDGSDRLRDGARVILPGDCIPMAGGIAGGGGRRGQGGQAGRNFGQGGAGAGRRGQGRNGQGGYRARTAQNGKCPAGMILAGFQASDTSAPGGTATAPTGGGNQPVGGAPAATGPAGAAGAANNNEVPAGPPAPTGQAFDQGAGASGRGGGGQGGRMMAMLAPLGLDAGQQAKATQIFADARAKAMAQAQANPDGDPAARGQAFRAANLAALNQLSAILRPDQKAKLPAVREQMQQARGGRGGGNGGGGFGGGGFGGGGAAQAQ